MAPLTYIRFLIPKWPVLMLASVISLLHLEFSPEISNYDTKDLHDSYDYIIVGAGTAGCVLANRLSADRRRTVLLIEAGGVENAATDIPLFALIHFHGQYDWQYRTEPQQYGCLGMTENRCDWARGKALGGSSVTNFQLYVRGNRRDFDRWEQLYGAKGWSYGDVLPYFKKFESYKGPNADGDTNGLANLIDLLFLFIEQKVDIAAPLVYERTHTHLTAAYTADSVLSSQAMNIMFEHVKIDELDVATAYRGLSGELPVTSPATKTELQPAFLKAGEELGFKVVDYNAKEQTGFAPIQATVYEGRRWSSAKSFIRPVFKDRARNLHISLLSKATKVVFDNKHAVGVTFVKDGELRTVRAKRDVILSAGTIGTTQLLLLSGIGPSEDLRKLGIQVVADLPVGHNLQDHLFLLGTCATTTKNVEVWPQSVVPVTQYALFRTGPFALPAGIEATAFMNTSYGSREYPDFQAHLLSISGASVEGERFIKDLGVRQDIYDAYFKPKRGSNAFHIGIALNRLKSRGFIKLRSRHYTDSPILDPRYYTHPDDAKMAAEGVLVFVLVLHDWSELLVKAVLTIQGIEIAMGQAIRLMKTKAFAALGTTPWDVHFPPCKSHPIWSNEYMQCLARYLSPTSWHQCCTNPMGSGKRAVVDPRLRVHGGVTGLRVVDASVMPDIVTGNLNAAVYMIAEKGAAMILEDNK